MSILSALKHLHTDSSLTLRMTVKVSMPIIARYKINNEHDFYITITELLLLSVI